MTKLMQVFMMISFIFFHSNAIAQEDVQPDETAQKVEQESQEETQKTEQDKIEQNTTSTNTEKQIYIATFSSRAPLFLRETLSQRFQERLIKNNVDLKPFTEKNIFDMLTEEQHKELLELEGNSYLNEIIDNFGISAFVYGIVNKFGNNECEISISVFNQGHIKWSNTTYSECKNQILLSSVSEMANIFSTWQKENWNTPLSQYKQIYIRKFSPTVLVYKDALSRIFQSVLMNSTEIKFQAYIQENLKKQLEREEIKENLGCNSNSSCINEIFNNYGINTRVQGTLVAHEEENKCEFGITIFENEEIEWTNHTVGGCSFSLMRISVGKLAQMYIGHLTGNPFLEQDLSAYTINSSLQDPNKTPLIIEGKPSSANVYIYKHNTKELVVECALRCDIQLSPNQYTIEISEKNYITHRQEITLQNITLLIQDINLVRMPSLTVTGRPNQAKATLTKLNSSQVILQKRLPIHKEFLEPADYILKIEKNGYVPTEIQFTLNLNEIKSLNYNLINEKNLGSIQISANPIQSTVIITSKNNQNFTKTINAFPTEIAHLHPGTYQLKTFSDGYISQTMLVKIYANRTVIRKFTLQKTQPFEFSGAYVHTYNRIMRFCNNYYKRVDWEQAKLIILFALANALLVIALRIMWEILILFAKLFWKIAKRYRFFPRFFYLNHILYGDTSKIQTNFRKKQIWGDATNLVTPNSIETEKIFGNITKLSGIMNKLIGDLSELSGNITNIFGDTSNKYGFVSYLLKGNISNLSGDLSNLNGEIKTNFYEFLNGNVTKIYGDLSNIYGNASNLSGNVSKMSGDVTNISGNVSRIIGDVTNLSGNVSNITGTINQKLIGNTSCLKGDISKIFGNLNNGEQECPSPINNTLHTKNLQGDISNCLKLIRIENEFYIQVQKEKDTLLQEIKFLQSEIKKTSYENKKNQLSSRLNQVLRILQEMIAVEKRKKQILRDEILDELMELESDSGTETKARKNSPSTKSASPVSREKPPIHKLPPTPTGKKPQPTVTKLSPKQKALLHALLKEQFEKDEKIKQEEEKKEQEEKERIIAIQKAKKSAKEKKEKEKRELEKLQAKEDAETKALEAKIKLTKSITKVYSEALTPEMKYQLEEETEKYEEILEETRSQYARKRLTRQRGKFELEK